MFEEFINMLITQRQKEAANYLQQRTVSRLLFIENMRGKVEYEIDL
jgi:hypothetical protein